MKKNLPLKITLVVFLSLAAILLALLSAFLIITAGVKIDENKLVKIDGGFEYYDSSNNLMAEEVGGNSVTSYEKIPDCVKNAFIAIEDKRFYHHRGVDFKALLRSAVNNARSFSFKEGGSTISQQLVKNTHLSGEKTFKRKLSEMRLAVELEKKYDKDEILEKYLNTIYFGSGAYGITDAARVYFDKSPEDLSLNEAATLAAVIKAPSLYSPFYKKENCEKRKNAVLKEMLAQGYIGQREYDEAAANFPDVTGGELGEYGYLYLAKKEVADIYGEDGYYGGKRKIYTAFKMEAQDALENALKQCDKACEKSAIMLNADGKIIAYYSTAPETNRQVGSALKPLVVYAPSIESGTVSEMTKILDEKTDFNGYAPSNYNDVYYGSVSVKESLAKSLNVCAAKILSSVGVKKSEKYLDGTGIEFTENDNSPCVALGCTEKGVALKDLTATYGVFLRGGTYVAPSVTSEKTVRYGRGASGSEKRIFSRGTCDVMNDMLSFTVTDGTAKKLSFLGFPVYAKTGTVGTKSGNTDAYCISYTSEYVLGVWYGCKNGEQMENSVTGGTLPSARAAEIWSELYKTRKPPAIEKSDETVSLKLDKLSYEADGSLLLADEIAPERYVVDGLFTKNGAPKVRSDRFSSPKIDGGGLSVTGDEITIRLSLSELYGANIYRTDGDKRELLFEIKGSPRELLLSDDKAEAGKAYEYSIVPYYANDKKRFYGAETILGKIKTPPVGGAGEWWTDDFE